MLFEPNITLILINYQLQLIITDIRIYQKIFDSSIGDEKH